MSSPDRAKYILRPNGAGRTKRFTIRGLIGVARRSGACNPIFGRRSDLLLFKFQIKSHFRSRLMISACYRIFSLNFGKFYPCAAELLSFKFLLAYLNFTLNLERAVLWIKAYDLRLVWCCDGIEFASRCLQSVALVGSGLATDIYWVSRLGVRNLWFSAADLLQILANFDKFWPRAANPPLLKFTCAPKFYFKFRADRVIMTYHREKYIATCALNFQNEREVFVKFNKISEILHRFNLFFIKKY